MPVIWLWALKCVVELPDLGVFTMVSSFVIERIGFGRILLIGSGGLCSDTYTSLFVVLFRWVLFRADDITLALRYAGDMLNFADFGLAHAISQLDNLEKLMER